MVWLDGEFEHSPEEWNFAEIREHIRALQPQCLVNDRCVGHGDFATLEQQLPETPPLGPWEHCMTMNDSWGFVANDDQWKPTSQLIESVVETVSAGGNLILNVGPRADGTFPPEASARLAELGRWVYDHEQALHRLEPGLRPWQCRLPSARRRTDDGELIFVYLTIDPGIRLVIRGLPVSRVLDVRVLADGMPLTFVTSASIPDIQSQVLDPRGQVVLTLPPDMAGHPTPVIVLHIAQEADADHSAHQDHPA